MVGLPLFVFSLVLSNIFLGLILQHGVFATRQLGDSIAEYILFLFENTVFHVVNHHVFSIHNAVGDSALCLQALICSDIKAVFNTKA